VKGDMLAHVTITIADYLLARLAELRVRHLFGVPGDFNLWFLEQLAGKDGIRFIGCCNELNAAYAADGCARLEGVSALAATYGVGELACLAGVAGAYASESPSSVSQVRHRLAQYGSTRCFTIPWRTGISRA
jgi:indolepyruvate decarboxylase